MLNGLASVFSSKRAKTPVEPSAAPTKAKATEVDPREALGAPARATPPRLGMQLPENIAFIASTLRPDLREPLLAWEQAVIAHDYGTTQLDKARNKYTFALTKLEEIITAHPTQEEYIRRLTLQHIDFYRGLPIYIDSMAKIFICAAPIILMEEVEKISTKDLSDEDAALKRWIAAISIMSQIIVEKADCHLHRDLDRTLEATVEPFRNAIPRSRIPLTPTQHGTIIECFMEQLRNVNTVGLSAAACAKRKLCVAMRLENEISLKYNGHAIAREFRPIVRALGDKLIAILTESERGIASPGTGDSTSVSSASPWRNSPSSGGSGYGLKDLSPS